jgi:hypothetical protein
MKSILTSIFLLMTFYTFGQTTNCEQVKQENIKLRVKLRQFGIDIDNIETKVNSYSNDIIVNFIKCIGDRKNQSVTVYFNVVNPSLTNQNFYLLSCATVGTNYERVKCQAFDEIGNGFSPIGATLASSKENGEFSSCGLLKNQLTSKLSTGNFPVLGSITFVNVLESVKIFKQIDIAMDNKNFTGDNSDIKNQGITEIKNVKIVWK